MKKFKVKKSKKFYTYFSYYFEMHVTLTCRKIYASFPSNFLQSMLRKIRIENCVLVMRSKHALNFLNKTQTILRD